MITGRLAGIARHGQPKGPMETVGSAPVTLGEGLRGDYRGGVAAAKPGRKRQVSLIEADGWRAGIADAGPALDWWHSRRNLLVEGLRLPRVPGVRLRIGASLMLEITDECEPCERMEALHRGLLAALTPDWRGGFLARVVEEGEIAVGDAIQVL